MNIRMAVKTERDDVQRSIRSAVLNLNDVMPMFCRVRATHPTRPAADLEMPARPELLEMLPRPSRLVRAIRIRRQLHRGPFREQGATLLP